MTSEEAIGALTMCRDLMLFDPMTGETHELWDENRDNQDLYNACGVAIAALSEQARREKGCEYCTGQLSELENYHSIHTPHGWVTEREVAFCWNCGKQLI